MRASLAFGLVLLASAPAIAADAGLAIQAGTAASNTITAEALAKLPTVKLSVAFGTEHGPRQAVFEGPLLWTVLDQAHAVDPAKAGGHVRQFVTLTGSDGYTAVLALGEISPDFEGKQVIVAERMDGKPLDHPRVVVPGDRRGGRSVHDVVGIAVLPFP